MRNAVARVNIYYADLSFYEVDESAAMTSDTYLGSIGGTLGLFLGIFLKKFNFNFVKSSFFFFIESLLFVKGASLLTFTELFEVLYLIVRSQIKKTLAKKIAKKLDTAARNKNAI
jgi:hypothetical protein